MSFDYVHRTERMRDGDGNELIVQLVADTLGGDGPRENDNFTRIYGDHRHYTIGDGTPPSEHMSILERGGLALLHRYMRRFGDPITRSKVLAFKKLCMLDHSGITFWTADMGTSPYHWTDPGHWDSGSVGYVYITQARWDELGGGDPFEAVDGEVKLPLGSVPVKQQRVYRMLDAEVEEYDDWSKGNVWGIVTSTPCDHADEHDTDEQRADCPHAERGDSVWGFIGDPDDVWPDACESVGLDSRVPAGT
jgi:hypothetical protein